jgi:hypothetical protein
MLFNKNMSERSALFICTVLENILTKKYNYANKNKGKKTINETITLPVDSDGNPD